MSSHVNPASRALLLVLLVGLLSTSQHVSAQSLDIGIDSVSVTSDALPKVVKLLARR